MSDSLDSVLLPQHLADLGASGLTNATIAELGFYSETDPKHIATMLRWDYPAKKLGACLCIPFFDAAGKLTNYVRVKPDTPRSKDGKPNKYESPCKTSNRVYITPAARSALSDTSIPLTLTEGEKKAAKAGQEGFACLGLVGVYGFQKKRKADANGKKRGPRELISDLEPVAWKGRTVYVVYDSDAASNPKVLFAEYHLAETLRAHGANVLAVRLPEGEGGAKVGLDDYLIAHGADAFRELLKSAKAPTKPKPPAPTKSNDEPDDPHRLANRFLERNSPRGPPILLRHWRGEWHYYDGAAYLARPDSDQRSSLTDWIREEFVTLNLAEVERWQADGEQGDMPATRKVTTRLVSDSEQALKGVCLLPATVNAPAWIGEPGEPDPQHLMPMRNGLLDLSRAAAGTPALFPSTPNFFALNAAPYDYDAAASLPNHWLTFLSELWPNDQQSIDALQEWFGYCLTSDTRQQKILFILGPKRSGKGTIARVMRMVFGPENVAGPTLGSLASNFGLSPLLGKPVAIISDAQLSGRMDAAVITERLKAISGEDAITVDRKHREPLTVKLPTRFTILANELPRLGDASGAIASRLIILRLTRSWYGREDHELSERLRSELPGILLWAIEGWRRLRDRGRLLQPASGRELVEDMEALSSPIGAFLADCCIIGPSETVEIRELYQSWKNWCDERGRKEPGTEQGFGRDLRAVLPALEGVRRRNGTERRRAYRGLRLRTHEDPEELTCRSADLADLGLEGPRGSAGSATLSNARMARESQPEQVESLVLEPVKGVMVRTADLADPPGPPHIPGGWGFCLPCGKPTGSMYTRTCRACVEAESNFKG